MAMMKRMNLGLALIVLLASAAARTAAPAAMAAAPVDTAALFPELQRAPAVVEGAQGAAARAVLYVFFDANCLYCHVTWKAVQAYEKAGLQVHWVPVAYQKDSSYGRAGAILGAPDPVEAFRRNESGYRADDYDGGIRPQATISAALRVQLDADTKLMQRFGVPATPALVWKDREGKVRVSAGVPHEAELPGMTGLPLQKYTDRELAKFR